MLDEFLTNINKNSLFNKEDYLLLAISGGIDSVVLAHLLYQAKFKFALAHCNFGLRGQDSIDDEKFCMDLAKSFQCPFYSIKFNTQQFAEDSKLSIQIAARQLRYNYFSEIMQLHTFKYLVTAHHLDDNIETVFSNILRETGIRGIQGMSLKFRYTIKPLLNFTKRDILKFATQYNIEYREDSSNNDTKYKRNQIRHNIIPALQDIQPSLYTVFKKNIQIWQQENNFIESQIEELKNKLITYNKNDIHIYIPKLLQHHDNQLILFRILHQYGFNEEQTKDIFTMYENLQSGKKIISEKYLAVLDRKYLIISKKHTPTTTYICHNLNELNLFSSSLYCSLIKPDSINFSEQQTSFIDYSKLIFPLIIRHKTDGDMIQPLGLNRKKKLSDIFINKKVSIIQKEKIILLCNANNDIVWVSHLPIINEQYKITDITKEVLKISINVL